MNIVKTFLIIAIFAIAALAQGIQPGPGLPNQSPGGGGGGGPVTVSSLSNQQRTTASAATFTTTGVTPTGGRRLMVVAIASDSGDSNDEMDAEMTISSSPALTWNVASTASISTPFNRVGLKAWLTTTDAAASSTTISVDAGTYDVYWRVSIIEVDGTDGTIAGNVVNETAALDGGYSVVLGATPTADDAVIFARVLRSDHNSGVGALDMAAGWTELRNDFGDGLFNGKLGVFYNDNTTSTSVVVDDTAVNDAYAGGAADMAFIIKAG